MQLTIEIYMICVKSFCNFLLPIMFLLSWGATGHWPYITIHITHTFVEHSQRLRNNIQLIPCQ